MTRRQKLRFRLDRLATPIGITLVVQDEHGRLRALEWEDHEARMTRLLRLHYGDDGIGLVESDGSGPIIGALRAYLAGELGALDAVPVETGGTTFQRRVWRELRRIRAGTTLSYGQLARRIGRPDAVRAVARANGSNPVSVVVPCHRVVGSDGTLTGYAGGLDRKRWLLSHEGVAAHDGRPAVTAGSSRERSVPAAACAFPPRRPAGVRATVRPPRPYRA
jgi:methylated-DNA-[protein]-cysteine S-methyltransferase